MAMIGSTIQDNQKVFNLAGRELTVEKVWSFSVMGETHWVVQVANLENLAPSNYRDRELFATKEEADNFRELAFPHL